MAGHQNQPGFTHRHALKRCGEVIDEKPYDDESADDVGPLAEFSSGEDASVEQKDRDFDKSHCYSVNLIAGVVCLRSIKNSLLVDSLSNYREMRYTFQ